MMSKSSSIPPLCLKSIKKHCTIDGDITTRVRSLEDTLANITPICKKIGVTRICDITYLDRLYIPNYCSVLPGTEDSIWVYSGKGPTKIHAKVSALMESVERYCSLSKTWSKSPISGSYYELSKTYKVLHPDEVVEPVESFYSDKKSIIDFVPGFDLIKEQEVLVPAQLVFSRYFSKLPSVDVFPYSHTNGLASGNVLEEAICQALCEVIERDAASIAELCASSIPYSVLEKIASFLKSTEQVGSELTEIYGIDFVDDSSIFLDVDISEFADKFAPLKYLVSRFADAGISLLIKDITQKDIGIPTFVASSIEWISSNYGYFAYGYGTHLDSRVALVRAITELSQTRAVNIQGARDDCKKIEYKDNDEIYKRKWQFMPATSSCLRASNKNTIPFSEIKSYVMDDILDDIKFILNRLKKSGLKRVIVVDLTHPKLAIPVVRVIVPGLETFEVGRLFRNTELIIGKRAKESFRKLFNF
jgi:ribosomal protein S12 methylthiotransferase accessory factor YcaO